MRAFMIAIFSFVSFSVLAVVPESYSPAPTMLPEQKPDPSGAKTQAFYAKAVISQPIGAALVYEKSLSDRVSLNPYIDFLQVLGDIRRLGQTSAFLAAANLGLKIYLLDRGGLKGLYLEPHFGLGYGQMIRTLKNAIDTTEPLRRGALIAAGISGGYAWAFDSGLYLDGSIGYTMRWLIESDKTSHSLAFPFPEFNLGIGYAW